jgi:multimeric flavodoxin WrbA
MKLLIIYSSPKEEGLCYSVLEAVRAGAEDGGAEVETVMLCDTDIARCYVCEDGWGVCKQNHVCAYGNDGFADISEQVGEAEAVVVITPVYWHEVSETLKSFMDRFRRCNFGENGRLSGKQVLLVVSAGGTGNGILPSLEQLDRFCRHTGAAIYDYIGINRWNSDYKRAAAYASAKALVSGRKNGDTV